MGALVHLVDRALAVVGAPAQKTIGAAIPTWESGVPQYAQGAGQQQYGWLARMGYNANDLVYAAIEELATSAAEPRLALYRDVAHGEPERLTTHPLLDLLERPNPFMDRVTFLSSLSMYLDVAGNCYLHKERSAAGKMVELWLLRPDRVRVIPDARRHIGGYDYLLGNQRWTLPAADVIHLRTRALTDDYYGLPPLAVAAGWAETANAVATFTRAFFENAAVPAGLLNIQRTVDAAERELLSQQFRGEFSGRRGWHRTLVLDGGEATFTPMGLPLGERGLAMPSLDEILEAHVVRPFGVPLELVGARLAMRGQRSAVREARAGFWDETMLPRLRLLAAQLQLGLADEPGYSEGWDRLDYDLSTVQALQEDADALMKRAVTGYAGGVLQRGEARKLVGQDATDQDKVYFMSRSSGLIDPDETLVPGGAAPELVGTPPPDPAAVAAVAPRQNGVANGVAHA